MNELKPCPFCGGKAEVHISHNSKGVCWYVACVDVNCNGASLISNVRNKPIQAWNKRVVVINE